MKSKKTLSHTIVSLPTFPSATACSGATGIPVATLRHAKRKGCSAFDQAGRVHLGPLLAWLFADDNADTNVDWHARWKRAQAIGLEQRVAKERGELIEINVWVKYVNEAAGAMRALFFEQISSAPLRLAAAGDDIVSNREVFANVMWDDVWTIFREKVIVAAERLQADRDAAQDFILNPKPEIIPNESNSPTQSKKTPTE